MSGAASNVEARWSLRLGRDAATGGVLELHRAEAGYFWRWTDKPAHLVQLVGVLDAHRPSDFKPRRFFDLEGAMRHLMDCAGIAFRGDCGLEQVH